MSRIKKDTDREHRIEMEIIVDAYGEEEHALGWYYYLDERYSQVLVQLEQYARIGKRGLWAVSERGQ